MANIKVLGSAAVVVSTVALADYQLLDKYRPDALRLKDEKGEETIFRVIVEDGAQGKLTGNGAILGKADADGKACITMVYDVCDGTDVREFLADKLGEGLLKLSQLESILPGIAAEVKTERERVKAAITVA